MKIQICSKPVFLFSLTRAEVDILMQMTTAHYDWKCKNAGQCGTDGFIYGWNNLFVLADLAGTPSEAEEIAIDQHELNICLKLMELPDIFPGQKKLVKKLSKAFYGAIEQTKREIEKWTTTYESESDGN